MVASSVFEHLVKYGEEDSNAYHQELTLTAIYNMLAHDTIASALLVAGLQPLVDTLMKSSTDGVRQEATRVNEKIKELSVPPECKLFAYMLQRFLLGRLNLQ